MKVLANDGISNAGVESLKKSGFEVILDKVAQEELISYINENKVEVLLVRSATKVRKDIIDACASLKIIGRGGVGMDNIDVEYAKEQGKHVINTPAASSGSVAEMVFAHLFSLTRFLHDSNRKMPLEGDTRFGELKKSYAKASELKGKTLGVIGFGRIGEATVKFGLSLGLNVKVYDPFIKEKDVSLSFFDGQTVTFKLQTEPLDNLLAESDFISLHVPSQKDYIIGAEQIAKMKDGAILVNAARGGVVDEVALLSAVESGKLLGAALDVFENEPKPEIKILMNPNFSLSPHVGGNTVEAQDRIGEELADQIAAIYKK